ncbi:MAG: amidohydrolase family protein [Deltaproteobacteria bacterium]|nr:amidohydrolase family protein [Deltaproteobacteria bacterium]
MNRLLLLLLVPSLAIAAPAKAPDCTVVLGARAHLPEGAEDGITAVVADGRIAALGASITGLGAPGDGGIDWNGRRCAFVDGQGLHLSAGLIEPHSTVGLVEIGLEAGTRHHDAGGPSPVRAHVRVLDGYDPLSAVIPVARREGITAAVIQPGGGSFSGGAGAVLLTGRTQAEAVVRDAQSRDVGREVAVRANLAVGNSFSARLAHLRSVLEETRSYLDDRRGWRAGLGTRPGAPPEESLAALAGVVEGEVPLILAADRASDLEVLSIFATQQGIQLVIEGAAEGWLVAEQLARAEIAVVLNPYVYGPGGFDQMHGRKDNGALLVSAGVRVMISTRSGHFARKLRQMAGNAVRGGMTHQDALAAITSVPAAVFGLGSRGRLAVGTAADVVLWNGDPLEVTSWPVQMWIGGLSQSLESRQSQLMERYRSLPGSPAAPLSLPE